MKIRRSILTLVCIALGSTFLAVNANADFYGTKSFVKPEKERKKAPKRKVKKYKKVKKADLKYVDESESAKVHLYDPVKKQKIKEDEKKEVEPKTAGGKKFKSMGCVMCHKKDSSRLGPSVKKLSKHYKGQKDVLIKYLQRKGKPIIEPERSSVMKTQLAKLRILSDEQYDDLARHILRGGK